MNNLIIALCIGIAAGILDVIPMLVQKLDKFANASAFTHWVILGLIIPFVDWNIQPWLTGLIIGVISAIPVVLMTFKHDKKSLIPIFIMSAILGIGVGWAGGYFI